MFSFFKNISTLKLSILIYLILIMIIYIYKPYLFNDNNNSELIWLIVILSIISYMISNKCS